MSPCAVALVIRIHSLPLIDGLWPFRLARFTCSWIMMRTSTSYYWFHYEPQATTFPSHWRPWHSRSFADEANRMGRRPPSCLMTHLLIKDVHYFALHTLQCLHCEVRLHSFFSTFPSNGFPKIECLLLINGHEDC